MFTGVGAEDFIIHLLTKEKLWDLLITHYRKGHVIGCGTKGKGDDSVSHDNGLAMSHAYSVLQVAEIFDNEGK